MNSRQQQYFNGGDILIIDNDLASLETLSSMLIQEGYKVRGIQDGQEGLRIIENNSTELVLLDIKLPGMGGFEICRKLKVSNKSSKIPVLIICGPDDVEDNKKAYEAGAVDYINKPFQKDQVLARVGVHLKLSRLDQSFKTRLKEQSQAVEESETRFRAFMDNVPASAYIKDQSNVHIYANKLALESAGKAYQDVIGKTTRDIWPLNIADKLVELDQKIINGDAPLVIEEWYDTAQGEKRWRKDIKFPIKLGSGKKLLGGIAVDITSIKKSEQQLKRLSDDLRESEERYRLIVESSPMSIFAVREGRFLFGNPSSADMLGFLSPAEMIGQNVMDVVAPEFHEMIARRITRLESGQDNPMAEVALIKKDGTAITVESVSVSIPIGGVLTSVIIAREITERKRKEERLKKALDEITELKGRLEQENIYLRKEIDIQHHQGEIVGKSEPVKIMLNRAEQVAQTDTTVLILGETGTGKELLARAIHRLSRRKDRSMVMVNCAALPATLIESELFGREKGAYTGAMSRQTGRFEIADGSTLFLDEIGELPLELQAKLLRILQEGQFERLGSSKTLHVDVRIIASTNRDLAKAVMEGRFREDLYYRLNVFSITVPPLRDRIEDIPMLSWAFTKELSKAMGKTIEKIPQKDMDRLWGYQWPGNIRELRNLIESAMIVNKSKTLRLRLPVDSIAIPKPELKLEKIERDHIKAVLEKTFWRVSGKNGAAERLGLKPTTLEYRMKKLGIERPK